MELKNINAYPFTEWESRLVRYFLTPGDDGDESDLHYFEVTPTTLATAMGINLEQQGEVVTAFKAMLKNHKLLDILKDDHGAWLSKPCYRSTSDLPNYFCFLVMTLFVANSCDDDTEKMGDFRERLAKLLGISVMRSQPLRGIAYGWKRLAFWIDRRIADGKPFRKLVLPDPGKQSHIGHALRLSFPSRKDVALVKKFLSPHDNLLNDPRRVSSLFAVYRHDASWGLKQAYQDFDNALLNGNFVLAEHPFWLLLERVNHTLQIDGNRQVEIDLYYDEYQETLFCWRIGKNNDTALNLSDAINNSQAHQSSNLNAALTRGLVFFHCTGYGKWSANADLPSDDRKVLIACDIKLRGKINARQIPTDASGQWFISQLPLSAQQAKAILGPANLLPTNSQVIVRARAIDGVKTHGAWLGRPLLLPRICAGDERPVCQESQTNCSISIDEDGRLVSTEALDGAYSVSPDPQANPTKANWRMRLIFSGNAQPHLDHNESRRQYTKLREWETLPESLNIFPKLYEIDPFVWAAPQENTDDLLEIIYADGEHGWNEIDLVALVRQCCQQKNPWDILRCLQDAGVIEPRLRSGWKGRTWTLVQKQLVQCTFGQQTVVTLEGACCAREIEEFKNAAKNLGGKIFRNAGIGLWSPPVIGVCGIKGEDLAQKLTYPFVARYSTAVINHLALISTPRTAEGYIEKNYWDFSAQRFMQGAVTEPTLISLRRLSHPTGRDHDIYSVTSHKGTENFLSRAAALTAAHIAAAVPLFEYCAEGIQCLCENARLPDALAIYLRRKHLRSPGFVHGVYTYPAVQEDTRHLSKLLPGCFAGMEKNNTNCAVRHGSGRLRVQWRNGGLCTLPE